MNGNKFGIMTWGLVLSILAGCGQNENQAGGGFQRPPTPVEAAPVTIGPVTVPLVLAMGLGFGNALDVSEGFGILSMASIGPIIAVQITGLWIRWKIHRRRVSAEQ